MLAVYAALALSRLEDFASSATLRTLLVGLVGGAILQAAWRAVASSCSCRCRAGRHRPRRRGRPRRRRPSHDPARSRHAPRAPRRPASRLAPQAQATWSTSTPSPGCPTAATSTSSPPGASRPHGSGDALVFDVDRLKHVNEVLGHANGDEALRQIGTALRETLRRRDVAGRLGGDEFAACCPAPASPTRSVVAASSPGSTTGRSRRGSPRRAQRRRGPDACQRNARRCAAAGRGRAGGGAQRGSARRHDADAARARRRRRRDAAGDGALGPDEPDPDRRGHRS